MPVFAVESIACWRREAGFLASWRVVGLFHYIRTASSRRRRRRGRVRPRRWSSTAWASSGSVTQRRVICRSGPPRGQRARSVTSPLLSLARSSIAVRGASPRPALPGDLKPLFAARLGKLRDRHLERLGGAPVLLLEPAESFTGDGLIFQPSGFRRGLHLLQTHFQPLRELLMHRQFLRAAIGAPCEQERFVSLRRGNEFHFDACLRL